MCVSVNLGAIADTLCTFVQPEIIIAQQLACQPSLAKLAAKGREFHAHNKRTF
jgi:hypothetical protein